MKLSVMFRTTVAALSVCLAGITSAPADVSLPGFYGDHMVLQRDMPLHLRGRAEPGEKVTVEFSGHTASVTAEDDGTWTVTLPEMQACSEPQTLTVKGRNTIVLQDVLVGEVWLCSGQSNMEWPVSRCVNAEAEAASARYPLIRHIKFAHRPSSTPLDDIQASWQVCSPETVPGFTGVGYFMARTLHEELQIPVGLINSSWGGTRIEPWTPPVGFAAVPALKDLYRSILSRTPGTDEQQKRLSEYIQAVEQWLPKARSARDSRTAVQPSPPFPDDLKPLTHHQEPTTLYNGMIHAIVGYPIRGAIWYQGESNHREGMLYFEKMKALIGGWRTLWNQGDFPFYYVQIAPYQYGSEADDILPKLWEAQAAALTIPRTGMVVINDIATLNDIHPPNKQEVGRRLALLALHHDYGRADLVARSPELESVVAEGNSLRVTFRYTGGGLKTSDGAAPTHFEIAGDGDSDFHPASARIDGDSVVLRSPEVPRPAAFRFAWHKLAEPNLTGATGLPVGAVRGRCETEAAAPAGQ